MSEKTIEIVKQWIVKGDHGLVTVKEIRTHRQRKTAFDKWDAERYSLDKL